MKIKINYEKMGENIKKYRINKNQSMEELSYITGINELRLKSIEKGVKSIKLGEIILICNLLDVKIDDILDYQVGY